MKDSESLGNSGLVNTPLRDLIRPLPGQRQAGEEADNRQYWARRLGTQGPRPALAVQGRAGRKGRTSPSCRQRSTNRHLHRPAPLQEPPHKVRPRGPLCQGRFQGPSVQSPVPLPVANSADNWEGPCEALDELLCHVSNKCCRNLNLQASVMGSSSPLRAVFSSAGRCSGCKSDLRSSQALPPCHSLTPTPRVLCELQRRKEQRRRGPFTWRGWTPRAHSLSLTPHDTSGRGAAPPHGGGGPQGSRWEGVSRFCWTWSPPPLSPGSGVT